MTAIEKVRAALGKVPCFEARAILPIKPGLKTIAFRYEWIQDWSAVAGLDYWDGAEWVTFSLQEPE